MIKVEIKSNFNADRIMDQILEKTRKRIVEQMRGVYCSEHHQYPTVTIVASSQDSFNVSIQGCCDDLVESAKNAIA